MSIQTKAFCLILAGTGLLCSAEPYPEQALGLQLAITAEPFDAQRNRWEINITPLIYQLRLRSEWQLKLMPLVNLRIDPDQPAAISHTGLSFSLLHNLSGHNDAAIGWYAGPHLGYAYNLADQNHNLTVAGEAGYAFELSEQLIFSVAAEIGMTWFDQLEDVQGRISENSWRSHLGVKPQFSWWY